MGQNSMKLLSYLITFIFFLPLTFVWGQSAQLPLDMPVIIDGEQLVQFDGENVHNLRLFSFNNGQPSVIPFQIDQRNSEGDWVWGDSQNKSLIYDNEDPENSHLLDHNDQLLFLTIDLDEQNESSLRLLLASNSALEVQVDDSILLSKSIGVKNMSLRIGLDFYNAAFENLYTDGLSEGQSLKQWYGKSPGGFENGTMENT
jgi:hypothetical protein